MIFMFLVLLELNFLGLLKQLHPFLLVIKQLNQIFGV